MLTSLIPVAQPRGVGQQSPQGPACSAERHPRIAPRGRACWPLRAFCFAVESVVRVTTDDGLRGALPESTACSDEPPMSFRLNDSRVTRASQYRQGNRIHSTPRKGDNHPSNGNRRHIEQQCPIRRSDSFTHDETSETSRRQRSERPTPYQGTLC